MNGSGSGRSCPRSPCTADEIQASGGTGARVSRCSALCQNPLIVSRFVIAVGATGQTQCRLDGSTLNITNTLNLGIIYWPVGHQNSAPPHSCLQSFVRYQMYATEREA